jgi:TorA maturation chaperone TorD
MPAEIAAGARWFAAALDHPGSGAEGGDAESVAPWLATAAASLAVRNEVDYSSWFEIGIPAPRLPLFERAWRGDGDRVLRELASFYRTYGVSADRRYPADHVSVELAFLSHLAALSAARSDRADLRCATAAFAREHPARWLPVVVCRADEAGVPAPYLDLLRAASNFVVDVANSVDAVAGG